jgi:DNA-binding Xre family transcriptional regulator
MSQYGISRLETGLARRVQFRTLHKLARVLGVEPEVLARNHPGPSSI